MTAPRLAFAVAAASLLSLTPAAAKTLVFCSEGNPEALNPQIITTTTGMNASRPMFNNLVEFAPGSTKIAPGLAESGRSPRTARSTPSTCGVACGSSRAARFIRRAR